MKYTNLYTTRIQKSFSEDYLNIMTTLKTAFKNDPKLEIQLINYYKGMPLSFNATISAINKDELELNVNPRQAVAISDDNYTFIRSKFFEHDIVAKAQHVDIKEKTVSLKQLGYVDIGAERRNYLRLRVHPPIEAQYISPNGNVRGEIIELSTAGTVMVVDYSVDIDTWEEGELHFQLHDAGCNTSCEINVPAKFITVLDYAMLPRFIFSFSADRISEKNISKFLYNRQSEIMRMLKEGCDIG
jgi:hypothetical protein